jgi:hypothetical protein
MDAESETTSTPRTRRATRATSARRDRPRRQSSPPNRVEPGWIHDAAAAAMLKSLQNRRMDVGEVADDFLRAIPGQDDAPEPAVLLARILAHVGHRIPGFRKIEKRLEGREARAGLGSDVVALLLQLYFRNRDLITVKAYRDQRVTENTKTADTVRATEGVVP